MFDTAVIYYIKLLTFLLAWAAAVSGLLAAHAWHEFARSVEASRNYGAASNKLLLRRSAICSAFALGLMGLAAIVATLLLLG